LSIRVCTEAYQQCLAAPQGRGAEVACGAKQVSQQSLSIRWRILHVKCQRLFPARNNDPIHLAGKLQRFPGSQALAPGINPSFRGHVLRVKKLLSLPATGSPLTMIEPINLRHALVSAGEPCKCCNPSNLVDAARPHHLTSSLDHGDS
jgi:hypothetical protein